MPTILCFGAAHFDRTVQCLGPYVPAASNPIRTLHRKPGGVARNIAVHLRLLGRSVAMLGAVGMDGDGEQILQSLSGLGIDTALINQIKDAHTAGYTAILDDGGELALGLMDAEIYETGLHIDRLRTDKSQLQRHGWWLVDANLPTESMIWLAENRAASMLCAATVSPSKAVRFRPILGDLDLLIANRAETAILTGIDITDITRDAAGAIGALQGHGIDHVIITLGATGIVACNRGDISFWPPLPTHVVDVNGAGDAFYAGFMSVFAAPNADFNTAIAHGLAMASLTAATEGTTVWNLDPRDVHAKAALARRQPLQSA